MLVLNDKDYDASLNDLKESLGVLPHWVAEATLCQCVDLKSFLEEAYGWGLHKFNGTVLDDGTYKSEFDEDKDLPFVGKMQTHKGVVYFYPYAMVAIPTDDGHFVTRMD